jgi:hypothetical protein
VKCSDCGINRAYQRQGLAWRLCRNCWEHLLYIIEWASTPANDKPNEDAEPAGGNA